MRTAVLGAITLTTLLTSAARAQNLAETVSPTGTFGNPGQVVISSDFTISFTNVDDVSTINLAPALDFFIAPNIALGGQVQFAYSGTDNVSNTVFGLGPRARFNIPLGPMFSLFPAAGMFFRHETSSVETGAVTVSRSKNLFALFFYAPFLFHPVPHFFIGLGPSIGGNVAGGEDSDRELVIGLESTVGGYFDW